MQKKTTSKAKPAFTTGIVTFEFWNNDDESLRDRTLQDIAKTARKTLGVSAYAYAEENDLERGYIAFAAVAGGISEAENMAAKVTAFLDENSPGRAIDEHWIAEEIP